MSRGALSGKNNTSLVRELHPCPNMITWCSSTSSASAQYLLRFLSWIVNFYWLCIFYCLRHRNYFSKVKFSQTFSPLEHWTSKVIWFRNVNTSSGHQCISDLYSLTKTTPCPFCVNVEEYKTILLSARENVMRQHLQDQLWRHTLVWTQVWRAICIFLLTFYNRRQMCNFKTVLSFWNSYFEIVLFGNGLFF